MMNEEEYIKERMGTKNPFAVPEGYFEQLSDRIMSQLEESPTKKSGTTTRRLRPWIAAASIAAVAAVSATLFFGKNGAATGQVADEAHTAYYDTNYINEEADYAMVDNQDIYAFLLADL